MSALYLPSRDYVSTETVLTTIDVSFLKFQLGSGLVIAEATLATNPSFSDFFIACKKYIVVSCQSHTWIEKLDDICQVSFCLVDLCADIMLQ